MEQSQSSLYDVISRRYAERVQPQVQRKATLTTLCHAIEDEVLNNELSPVIFAAFQNERYYEREHSRYDQLRQTARAVTLYGRSLSAEVRYDRDWFVVINEPRFKVVLASYEIEPDQANPAIGEAYRPFLGIWSYDHEIVDFATRYLAGSASPEASQASEEVIGLPHQAVQQVKFVSSVSDRILANMERTNQHALLQLNQNQRLLLDLEHQTDLLQRVDQAKQLAENERNILHKELDRLYEELTRSQTVMTQAIIDRARLEQTVETSKALLQQVHAQLKTLDGAVPTDPSLEMLEKVQNILHRTQP